MSDQSEAGSYRQGTGWGVRIPITKDESAWLKPPPSRREEPKFEWPKGKPFVPATTLVPMTPLQTWYAKEHKCQLSKEQYVVWDNNEKQPLFTALFVCPLTGEVWASGRYSDKMDPDQTCYKITRDETNGVDVVWYPHKKSAKHAAAARALDCLYYRHSKNLCIGKDTPYFDKEAPPLPTMPQNVSEQVANLKRQAQERMDFQIEKQELDQEAERYRKDYRTQRGAAHVVEPMEM